MKKLIISPHVDDDILGCGGILDKNSLVIYCGIDDFHVISRDERIVEAELAAKLLGHNFKILHGNKVNSYKCADLIDQLSKEINAYKPDQVYIPYPSYNQDHQEVYKSSLIALRPHDINYFVKEILIYEQPHVYLWDHSYNIDDKFKPNCFFPINVDKKIEAYNCMKSQVRNFRSSKQIRALATLRGAQCNQEFAESFMIIRSIRS